jgi:hypothetical protein
MAPGGGTSNEAAVSVASRPADPATETVEMGSVDTFRTLTVTW